MDLVNRDLLEVYSIVKCFTTGKIAFEMIIPEKNDLFNIWSCDNCLPTWKIMKNLKSLPYHLSNFQLEWRLKCKKEL